MSGREWHDFGDSAGDRWSAPPPPGAGGDPRASDVWSAFGAVGAQPDTAAGPRARRGRARVAPDLLVAGLVAGGIGILAGALAGPVVPVAFVGWLVAGPVAIGLTALHVHRATRLRAGGGAYTEARSTGVLYRAVMVVALAGVVLNALAIADWAGRL